MTSLSVSLCDPSPVGIEMLRPSVNGSTLVRVGRTVSLRGGEIRVVAPPRKDDTRVHRMMFTANSGPLLRMGLT